MLYLIDKDGVRSRVNRKLFAQAMPEEVLKCATELDTVCTEPSEGAHLLVVVNVEGLDASTVKEWMEAMNRRHVAWSWFAFLNRNESIPDWLPALRPTGILCEPLDMHVLKQAFALALI